MDWMNFWARNQMIEKYWGGRARKKAEEQRREKIYQHRLEISEAMSELSDAIMSLTTDHLVALDMNDTDMVDELLPLFPLAEVLSLQGMVGEEQRAFLEDHFGIEQPRYNIAQFIKAAVEREGIYSEWENLVGLSRMHCGKVWKTLIELVCRMRAPALMQNAIDAIGKIYYHFWLMEHENIDTAQVRYSSILSFLNQHSEDIQKEPYFHAFMLLQLELAKKYGGEASEYIPCFDAEGTCDMDGVPGLCFSVHKKGEYGFIHFYAVRERKNVGDPDLIWECPPGGKPPVVFFSE